MATPDSGSRSRSIAGLPVTLLVSLAALGAILSIFVVPAPFTIDDNNYLVNVVALRDGHVTVANTAGLTPSRELLFFDPGPKSRRVDATPVGSVAPPLYGVVALPFSYLGWRGLVALNTLAYLATIGLVFAYARRYAQNASTPWLAATAFAFGGFAMEYAQGMWPHALSVLLCTAAIVLAGRSIESGRIRPAAGAGLLLAVAAGVRYQNAALLVVVACGVFLLAARRRLALASVFAAAAILPLLASSAINHARLGSWNPISKGQNYLRVPLVEGTHGSLADPLITFWAQVVDYSARPPLTDPTAPGWMAYEPATGAHLMMGAIVKKALVQSAPWVPVALVAFLLAWSRAGHGSHEQRRQLRLLSLVMAAVFAVFSLAGVSRHDGLAFNARYMLELLPLTAVAFAWAMDALALPRRALLGGAAAGAGVVWLVLLATPIAGDAATPLWLVRQWAILKIPLVLSLALVGVWLATRRRAHAMTRRALAAGVGAALGWGLVLHVSDDMTAANALRRHHLGRAQALEHVLPDGSALIAYWGQKVAPGALLLGRDVVIVDPWPDDGRDTPALIRDLFAAGRRVFVIRTQMPPDVLQRISEGFVLQSTSPSDLDVVELRPLGS